MNFFHSWHLLIGLIFSKLIQILMFSSSIFILFYSLPLILIFLKKYTFFELWKSLKLNLGRSRWERTECGSVVRRNRRYWSRIGYLFTTILLFCDLVECLFLNLLNAHLFSDKKYEFSNSFPSLYSLYLSIVNLCLILILYS